MKITYTPPVKALDKVRKKNAGSSASGVDFEGFLEGTEETGAAGEAQAASGVNSFLFMQEVSDEQIANRKAYQQGKQAISVLEQLHRDLLMGTVPETTLRRLKDIVNKPQETFTDPHLKQMLDEIELRAAVELAKLEKAQAKESG
jgi:hypothetical protein